MSKPFFFMVLFGLLPLSRATAQNPVDSTHHKAGRPHYLPIDQKNADCADAFPLGDKSFLHFAGNEGIGKIKDAPNVACFMNGENFGQAEENATWISFKIQAAGQLTFIITPDSSSDDLDFVLFKLPENGNCNHKKIVRCMAAGDSRVASDSPCMGQTGLYKTETDTSEDAGCNDAGDNNWLKPLDAQAGDQYVLLVSNITGPRGFVIYFKGSALLESGAPAAGEKKD